jgi:hypothetical protein
MTITQYREAVASLNENLKLLDESEPGSSPAHNAEILVKANGLEVEKIGREFRAGARVRRAPKNPDVALDSKTGKAAAE